MRILVTFAVDWEFKPWQRLRRFHRTSLDGRMFQSQVAGTDVNVVLTGVGLHNALRTLRALTQEVPDICIVSGLAGALKSEHRPAEVLVARAVCSDASHETFRSDQGLFSLAVARGAKAVERFVSVSKLAQSLIQKASLSTMGDAADMESFTVMAEMSRLGVPSVVLRSISDPAELDLPLDFDLTLDSSGRVRIARVLAQAVRAPLKAWSLAQFGISSLRAAEALAKYLDANISYLGERTEHMPSVARQVAQ